MPKLMTFTGVTKSFKQKVSMILITILLIATYRYLQSSETSANIPSTAASSIYTTRVIVTRVVDGDTFHITLNGKDETVRMIGVDTPETHHPEKPVQPYGPEAENYTRTQLEGKPVYIEMDVQERDKYGRLLAYVWLSEPTSASEIEVRNKMYNANLLINGYAQVMTISPNVKYADLFSKLQAEARSADKGLWQNNSSNTSNLTNPTTASPSSSSNSSTSSSSGTVKKGPGPNDETIKGNINSKGEKIYHTPSGQFYDEIIPEYWFFSEEEAQAAGFRPSKR